MQNTFKEQAKTKLILSPFEPDVIVHRYLWTLPWAHRCPSSVFSMLLLLMGETIFFGRYMKRSILTWYNETVPQECTTNLHHPSNHWRKVYQKSNHILFVNLLDCQPPPPNNGMAWHGIIHQFQRLHELIELLHMALLNVELITKLSNVWMDPVSASLGWNPRNGMGTKASSKPLKWRNNMGNHETQNYEPNMLVSGNCCSL